MPIIIPPKTPTPQDRTLLEQKRAERWGSKGTKYHILRKDKTPDEYKGVKVVVDGEEQNVSESSKFLLDMLIGDEKPDS